MNKKILLKTLFLTVILSSVCFAFYVNIGKTNKTNIDFLKKYGWEVVPEPIETSEFIIPEVFDDVYKNYNELQNEAGLDLTPYAGCKAVRYTYEVTNFPLKVNSKVRANVIVVDLTPVGGDICTVNLDGFMYSLNFNTQACFLASHMIW